MSTIVSADRGQKMDYTYGVRHEGGKWMIGDSLVERLRLFIESQRAGNSGHTNEIVSIVEELREADIVV